VSVSALMWSWTAPLTTKSVRGRSAFATVQTAKSEHGVSPVTVPELDSVGTSVTRTWMSVWRMAANTAVDVRTRLGRSRVIVHRLGSREHSVS